MARLNCSNQTKIKLLQQLKTPDNIWNAKEKQLKQKQFQASEINEILNPRTKFHLEEEETFLKSKKILLIHYLDARYPKRLNAIEDFPVVLFAIGNINLLEKTKIVAMVGSRECTRYGINVAKEIAINLSKDHVCVISGLAKGIDYWSHLGALSQPGNTIAVLGSGIDVIYPKENKTLYEKIIAKNGLILSEYRVGTTPKPAYFPKRNRIISGLANCVIVIEAGEKSGALITAEEAILQNKPVYAVPGGITQTMSKGCNRLIYDGAIPILNTTFRYGYQSLFYGGY